MQKFYRHFALVSPMGKLRCQYLEKFSRLHKLIVVRSSIHTYTADIRTSNPKGKVAHPTECIPSFLLVYPIGHFQSCKKCKHQNCLHIDLLQVNMLIPVLRFHNHEISLTLKEDILNLL